MRIAKTTFYLLTMALMICLTNCKSSQVTAQDTNTIPLDDSEYYLMVRVNKSENGLKLVSSEKDLKPAKGLDRTDQYAANEGDLFRCDLLTQDSKVISFREKTFPFKFPGATEGTDAIVTFFIPYIEGASSVVIYHQKSKGVWQEILATELP